MFSLNSKKKTKKKRERDHIISFSHSGHEDRGRAHRQAPLARPQDNRFFLCGAIGLRPTCTLPNDNYITLHYITLLYELE